MKKLSYIALLLILLLQTGGMVLIFKVQQCIAHFEMKHAISNNATSSQTFSLSLSDFKNKINENEFLIDGKLYDVISFSITGNNVQLVVINDKKEEDILEKIKGFTAGISKHSKLPTQLVQLLALTYILPNYSSKSVLQQIPEQKYVLLCVNVFSVPSEVSSPPPKLIKT